MTIEQSTKIDDQKGENSFAAYGNHKAKPIRRWFSNLRLHREALYNYCFGDGLHIRYFLENSSKELLLLLKKNRLCFEKPFKIDLSDILADDRFITDWYL